MSSTGRILNIARGALAAQEAAMNTAGHNIANVNTPGYSRQRTIFAPKNPEISPWGMIGSGVDISTIEQLRDKFIDAEIKSELQDFGKWEYKDRVFSQVEMIYNEPSDTGLSTLMRDFWDSWSQLANDPQSASSRQQVRQTGISLVNKMNNLDTRLKNLQSSINKELKQGIEGANGKLKQVADLNRQIMTSETRNGVVANDYRDRRNMLLEDLSKFFNIGITEDTQGAVSITLDGNILVEKYAVNELATKDESDGSTYFSYPIMARNGQTLNIGSGELKGMLDMRDEVIVQQQDSLNELAAALISSVNTAHQAGYGKDGLNGRSFFDVSSTGISDIALDSQILDNSDLIAASSDGTAGNGDTALAIAGLESQAVLSGSTVTMEDHFASMIGTLGVQTQEAGFMLENQNLMVDQLKHQQDAMAGVSLDEEMTNLIRYQHAYQAAARLVSTVDEMMETLVNMV